METAIHTTLGEKVRLYKRPNSTYWQCSTFLNGKKRRSSSKTDSLAQAKDFAEDWYLTLRGKQRWSQDFVPVVKMDRLMRKTIHNDETKEPFS